MAEGDQIFLICIDQRNFAETRKMSRGNQAVVRLDSIQSHLKPAHYDVAVVGLGALGSAAAYYAAKKGAKVIGLEQFEFGHVRGASSDTSRIIRTSYELPQYVSLAQLAYQEWANLEAEAKQKLVTITGGVVILEKDGVPNGKSWAEALDAREVPYELLDAKAANERWPAFNIKDHQEVMYTENSGIVHASKSVAAFQSLARARGARLVEHTKGTYWRVQGIERWLRQQQSSRDRCCTTRLAQRLQRFHRHREMLVEYS